MGKPRRSPIVGFNHNVRYDGKIYHVQTEDSGPKQGHIFTHLFFGGSIIESKRQTYDGDKAPGAEVKKLMQEQHKAILRDLTHKRLDEKIVAFFEATRDDATTAPELTPPEFSQSANQFGAVPSATSNGPEEQLAEDQLSFSAPEAPLAPPLAPPIAPQRPPLEIRREKGRRNPGR